MSVDDAVAQIARTGLFLQLRPNTVATEAVGSPVGWTLTSRPFTPEFDPSCCHLQTLTQATKDEDGHTKPKPEAHATDKQPTTTHSKKFSSKT